MSNGNIELSSEISVHQLATGETNLTVAKAGGITSEHFRKALHNKPVSKYVANSIRMHIAIRAIPHGAIPEELLLNEIKIYRTAIHTCPATLLDYLIALLVVQLEQFEELHKNDPGLSLKKKLLNWLLGSAYLRCDSGSENDRNNFLDKSIKFSEDCVKIDANVDDALDMFNYLVQANANAAHFFRNRSNLKSSDFKRYIDNLEKTLQLEYFPIALDLMELHLLAFLCAQSEEDEIFHLEKADEYGVKCCVWAKGQRYIARIERAFEAVDKAAHKILLQLPFYQLIKDYEDDQLKKTGVHRRSDVACLLPRCGDKVGNIVTDPDRIRKVSELRKTLKQTNQKAPKRDDAMKKNVSHDLTAQTTVVPGGFG